MVPLVLVEENIPLIGVIVMGQLELMLLKV
jgi:hypothetical protein